MMLRAPALLLMLASCTQEVQGLEEGQIELVNVAPEGMATQSSTLSPYVADRANDGDPDTFCHTRPGQTPARWELRLRAPSIVRIVTIRTRRSCCRDRSRDLNLVVLDAVGGAVQFDYAAIAGHLINPGNVMMGPDMLSVDLWEVAGKAIRGAVVRIERTPDPLDIGYPDSNDREANISTLNLGEVEVWVPRL
jgi:hypothetical protein